MSRDKLCLFFFVGLFFIQSCTSQKHQHRLNIVWDSEPKNIENTSQLYSQSLAPVGALCDNFQGIDWEGAMETPQLVTCYGSTEAVLADLPPWIQSHWILITTSGSTQPATTEYPRLLFFTPGGGHGSFVLSTHTHPESEDILEMMVWHSEKNQWIPQSINFTSGITDNETCARCHGENFHGIWGSDQNWPETLDPSDNIDKKTANLLLGNSPSDPTVLIDRKQGYFRYIEFGNRKSYAVGEKIKPNTDLSHEVSTNKNLLYLLAKNQIRGYVKTVLSDPEISENQVFKFIYDLACQKKAGDENQGIFQPPWADDEAKNPYAGLGYPWQEFLNFTKNQEPSEYLQMDAVKNSHIDIFVVYETLYQLLESDKGKPTPILGEHLSDFQPLIYGKNTGGWRANSTKAYKNYLEESKAGWGKWQNAVFHEKFLPLFANNSKNCQKILSLSQ